jgi:riboflavin synthase
MFTGIIEEMGVVKSVRRKGDCATLRVAAKEIFSDLRVGDSVCVDGVCLTVTRIDQQEIEADISLETLRRSTLQYVSTGDRVNLERALTPDSRIGGHFVLGHVDGVGKLLRKMPEGGGYRLVFEASGEVIPYLIEKGSIAVNGVSLTIAGVEGSSFSIAVIPHTLERTNLRFLQPGQQVNLEADIIGKYVHRYLQRGVNLERSDGGLMEKLQEGGFFQS